MQTIPAFYFDPLNLQELSDKYRTAFATAAPFEHVVIDNFVPENILNLIVEEFPSPDKSDWKLWGPGATRNTQDKNIEKLGTSDENTFGAFTRHFMAQLNSASFLKFLESLTGFEQLLADPSYNGCGLHSTGRGGKLMVHVDTNRHPHHNLHFHQRLNLILFLNKDWKEEYGGHLEFWNKDVSQCVNKVLPVFNRCVIFHTGTKSFHGHPHPLTCPPQMRRNSLAVYYYNAVRELDDNYDSFRTDVEWRMTTRQEKFYRLEASLRRFVPFLKKR